MSSPSPQDGNGSRNDVYFQYAGTPLQEAPTLNQLMQQSTQIFTNPSDGGFPIHQVPPNPILWPNPLIGAPFIQTTAILQNQQQQQQQQQHQHYNDYMYNLHMQQTLSMPPSAQQESYSVLPVGFGNFLKIYHCNENGETPLPNEAVGQQTFPTRHQTNQHGNNFHINQQNGPQIQPQFFNNYELFSSSGTLLNTQDINAPLNRNTTNPAVAPTSLASVTPIAPAKVSSQTENLAKDQESSNTTNFIINNLVNNWSPNLTGDSYMNITGNTLQEHETTNALKKEDIPIPMEKTKLDESIEQTITSKDINENPVMIQNASANEKQKNRFNETRRNLKMNNIATVETKKRIVAEVKPMRMTYSDVLSKVNNEDVSSISRSGSTTSSNNSIKPITANSFQNERKTDKNPQRYYNDNDSNAPKSYFKKSPTHDNKETQQNSSKVKRRSNSGNNSYQNNVSNTTGVKSTLQSTKTNPKVISNSGNEGKQEKRNASKSKDRNSDSNSSTNANRSPKKGSFSDEKDFNSFYNVTAKSNTNLKNDNSGTNTNTASSTSNSNINRKSSKNNTSNNSNQSNSSNFNYSYNNYQSRNRYSSSNVSYSYSSKRSRGNTTYGSSSNTAAAATNRNYELAKKFLKAWGNYMLRALIWFYYLIYDIIVLSCTILYDRITYHCIKGFEYSKEIIKDIKNNSNKPSILIKAYWRRFDGQFSRGSKWAIWRKIYEKPPEPAPENYKSGRLPTTGEEAMYSLLNCKGKDAYSILGVPPNCPQEQIRKHYKKIAVLVHPDKNKQAGAEEAFKVLQRAFELIGEPENRLAYDQSLVEALQAEKAWSELHVLLSQLQTKIAEAANTIRCSTCSLRHPRKLVDRPHYAARQCNACKTQHSAREGDIWAETYFFGLRWKYLALMEGKVYDVTQWAFCQKGALAQLEPNSHLVQYRIVRGAQQQQEQPQQKHRDNSKRHQSKNPRADFPGGKAPWEHSNFKHDIPSSDATFEDFLDNLYSGQNPNQKHNSAYSGSTRRRSRRN